MGPTASGKTGLAAELAQQLPIELVSVDSALVYRDMNIGTAKPDAATLKMAPHFLMDIIDPVESYSAAQFRCDAIQVMEDITKRGNIPLLVGGTMLYFNVLQHGLNHLPEADPEVRNILLEQARQNGWPAMHARLAIIDPETAFRLHPTDAQRIERALEIWMISGQSMTSLLKQKKESPMPYRLLKLALMPSDRAVLHQRISERFDLMLHQGLEQEVLALRRQYPLLERSMPSMRCVGYRQMWAYIEGEIDHRTMRDKGISATRQLAKRQMTWLRGMHDIEVIDCLSNDLCGRIEHLCDNHMKI